MVTATFTLWELGACLPTLLESTNLEPAQYLKYLGYRDLLGVGFFRYEGLWTPGFLFLYVTKSLSPLYYIFETPESNGLHVHLDAQSQTYFLAVLHWKNQQNLSKMCSMDTNSQKQIVWWQQDLTVWSMSHFSLVGDCIILYIFKMVRPQCTLCSVYVRGKPKRIGAQEGQLYGDVQDWLRSERLRVAFSSDSLICLKCQAKVVKYSKSLNEPNSHYWRCLADEKARRKN